MLVLEVYLIVHCGGKRWLNYQTSSCSLTDHRQQLALARQIVSEFLRSLNE